MGDSNIQVTKLRLSDGNQIPLLAYGTGGLVKAEDAAGKVDRSIVDQIKTAIRVGYRHIDAAEKYGTEPEVGVALKECGVPRHELFVSSKVFDPYTGDVHATLQTSLENLQTDYVDLYLIHQAFFAKSEEDIQKAWAEMEKIKASGKARSIGVSNFTQQHIEAILKTCTTPPAMNQTEYHPYLQRGNLRSFLSSKSIALSGYGARTPTLAEVRPGPLDGRLKSLAEQYKVSEVQVLLKWSIDQNVVTVITTSKEERMREALAVFDIEIGTEDEQMISEVGLEKQFRRRWGEVLPEGDFS